MKLQRNKLHSHKSSKKCPTLHSLGFKHQCHCSIYRPEKILAYVMPKISRTEKLGASRSAMNDAFTKVDACTQDPLLCGSNNTLCQLDKEGP